MNIWLMVVVLIAVMTQYYYPRLTTRGTFLSITFEVLGIIAGVLLGQYLLVREIALSSLAPLSFSVITLLFIKSIVLTLWNRRNNNYLRSNQKGGEGAWTF